MAGDTVTFDFEFWLFNWFNLGNNFVFWTYGYLFIGNSMEPRENDFI